MREFKVERGSTLHLVSPTRSEPFEAVGKVIISIDHKGEHWVAEFIFSRVLWEAMGRPARVFVSLDHQTGNVTLRASSAGVRCVGLHEEEQRSSVWIPAFKLGLPQAARSKIELRANVKAGVLTIASIWPEWLRGEGDNATPPVMRPAPVSAGETKVETLQRELRDTLRKVDNLLTALKAETGFAYRIGPRLSVELDL